MASIGSSVLPASALLSTPKIVNYPLAAAATEYSISVPIGAKKITFHLRGNAILKVAETSGDIAASLYFTIFPGVSYNVDSVTGSATIVLYVESSKPSQVLELWYWI
jgi:hypothetical protein